jgi:hypothetical protein
VVRINTQAQALNRPLDADFTRGQVVVRVLELMGYFDDE